MRKKKLINDLRNCCDDAADSVATDCDAARFLHKHTHENGAMLKIDSSRSNAYFCEERRGGGLHSWASVRLM